ncbi:MAG: nucleotidyltransferase domain-containing protein [Acidobacteriota bacterium]|nr:nucleotidyltransferase domain-containing protein [Acidobacteriota bacterium]
MNNMERERVDGELLAQLTSALEEREEILEAYLFGSHACGQARPHSDIDVAVYIDEERAGDGAWGYQAQLATDLMIALGTNDVDVVVLNKASILLYHRVLRDGVRLMSRDLGATTTRAGQALSRYFDFLPQLDKMDRARRHAAGSAIEDQH